MFWMNVISPRETSETERAISAVLRTPIASTMKLPRILTKSQAKHHREARNRDEEAKAKTKEMFDKKHRAKQVDIQIGDKAYRRNRTPSTTKGPWEPVPHHITKVVHNQITGTRNHTKSMRDRGDWKQVKERPAHLQFPSANHDNNLPTIQEFFTQMNLGLEEVRTTSTTIGQT